MQEVHITDTCANFHPNANMQEYALFFIIPMIILGNLWPTDSKWQVSFAVFTTDLILVLLLNLLYDSLSVMFGVTAAIM